MSNSTYQVLFWVVLGLLVVIGTATCVYLAARARRFDPPARRTTPIPVEVDG
jgi:hypothetical protein